LTVHH